jgi:hypothetical protein
MKCVSVPHPASGQLVQVVAPRIGDTFEAAQAAALSEVVAAQPSE